MLGKMAEILEGWQKALAESDEVVVESEVDKYLLDPMENPKDEDWQLLDWWKINGCKYLNLALVARDVLAIQVSTVASESSYSTGGRVIDPFRSSLTPKSVEALIFLQNWIKKRDQSDIKYYPSLEELEFYEKMERDVAAKGKEVVESDEEEPFAKAGTSSSKSAKVSKRAAAATPSTSAAGGTSKSSKTAKQGLLPPRKAKGKKKLKRED